MTITLWQNCPKSGPMTIPKFHFITLDLSACDYFLACDFFWPCSEVVTISDNYSTNLPSWRNALGRSSLWVTWEEGVVIGLNNCQERRLLFTLREFSSFFLFWDREGEMKICSERQACFAHWRLLSMCPLFLDLNIYSAYRILWLPRDTDKK